MQTYSGMMLPSNFEGRYFILSEPAELFCNLHLAPHTKKETMTRVLFESISFLIIELRIWGMRAFSHS